MNRQKKTILASLLFSLLPFFVFAQEGVFSSVDIAIARALDNEQRSAVIEMAMRQISVELTLEYVFAMQGKQVFELMDAGGQMASKLTYPVKGQMVVLKGEAGFLSKVFLGGRYGNSDFRKTVCSDEDWNLYDPSWPYGSDDYIDYQITRQDSRSKVELFDINLYYRILDLDEEDVRQRRLSSEGETIFDSLLVDSLSLDIFIGYQRQKGRYRMVDPLREYLFFDEGDWYYVEGLPADYGLDSFYKIKYKGPRLGLRARGSAGKVSTGLSFSFAWLETEAYGWWNLRELAYWQKGKNGYGVDLGWDITYAFTPSLRAGLGFNYSYYRQNKLKMYALEEGIPWWEGYQDRIRNADCNIYGPSFILKFVW